MTTDLAQAGVAVDRGARSRATPGYLQFAVFLTIVSSCVVWVEPAPCDLFFMVALTVALLSGHSLLPRRLSPFAYLGIFLFVFANILSGIFSESHAHAVFYASVTIYLLALWLLTVSLIGRYGLPLLETIFTAYVVAAVAAATLGLLARFHLIPYAEAFMTEEGGHRVRSTFKDPNVFGPFLVAAIVPLVSNLITGRRSFWLQATAVVLLSLGVLVSFSRGAYVNLGFALAVLCGSFVFVLRDSRVTRRLVPVVVMGAVLIAPLAASLIDRAVLWDVLVERLRLQDYDSERFEAQARAVSVSFDHVLGLGPGQSSAARFRVDPHNVYLRVLAENGLLGLLGFAMFLGACLRANLRGILARGRHVDLYVAGFSVIAGMLLEGLIIDTLHWRHFFLFLALPVGLLLSEYGGPEDQEHAVLLQQAETSGAVDHGR